MAILLERTHQGVDPVRTTMRARISLALILAIRDRHERINTDLLVRNVSRHLVNTISVRANGNLSRRSN